MCLTHEIPVPPPYLPEYIECYPVVLLRVVVLECLLETVLSRLLEPLGIELPRPRVKFRMVYEVFDLIQRV